MMRALSAARGLWSTRETGCEPTLFSDDETKLTHYDISTASLLQRPTGGVSRPPCTATATNLLSTAHTCGLPRFSDVVHATCYVSAPVVASAVMIYLADDRCGRPAIVRPEPMSKGNLSGSRTPNALLTKTKNPLPMDSKKLLSLQPNRFR